jgi:hypothetical protein
MNLSWNDIRARERNAGKTTVKALREQAYQFPWTEAAAFIKNGDDARVNIRGQRQLQFLSREGDLRGLVTRDIHSDEGPPILEREAGCNDR